MSKLGIAIGLMTALAAAAPAEAAPTRINFTGRLSTASGPVNGAVNVTFKLYPALTGGTDVWSETQSGIGADNGLVFVELGAQTTLDTSVFTGDRMFLEITIGNESLSPRLAINSVPYAINASAANAAATLGGTIGPGDVITSAIGNGGVSAVKAGNALSVSLATTGCSTGHVYKFDGTAFSCQPDANTTYTGAGAIAVSGSTISLSTTGCVAGEVWKFDGAGFSCEPDTNTTYTAAGGVAINGATISLSTTGCVAGEVWKFNGTSFACVADDNTTYTAGTGLSLAGTQFGVAAGGITMSRLNLPSGTFASSQVLSASGSISPSGATFIPEGTGSCLVTAHLTTLESNATGYVDVQVTRNGLSLGPEQTLTTGPAASRYSTEVTAVVPVSAGASTSLGCGIDILSGSSFAGNSFTCTVSFVCFS